MAVVALLAILTGTRRAGVHALAFAVVVLVVLSPPLASSWGFALSVTATGGLILLAGLAWLVLEYSGGEKLTFDLTALKAQAANEYLRFSATACRPHGVRIVHAHES